MVSDLERLEAEVTRWKRQAEISAAEVLELRADIEKLSREKHAAVQKLVQYQSYERKQEQRIGKRKR